MKDPFRDGIEIAKQVDKPIEKEELMIKKNTMYAVSSFSSFPFEIVRSCINFRFSATYS